MPIFVQTISFLGAKKMIKADKHSIAGILLAVFCVAVLGGTGILNPIFANGLGSAPREIRLGADLGIISEKNCTNRYLKQVVTKKDFANKLAVVMNTLGVQETKLNDMYANGILDSNKINTALTRKEAVEMMARAVLFMSANQIFNYTPTKSSNYKDYIIPEKYSRPMGYLQSKFVVRGLQSNYLGSSKKLTQREAVYFLYRLYEAISSDKMTSRSNDGLCFIDVSLDNPIMDSIKDLTAAGAFDRSILRPSFDGDSYIGQDDLTEVIGGIFDRSGKECDMLRLQTIFSDKEQYTTRSQMALVLEFLLDSFAANKINTTNVEYVDISKNDPEYQALTKLAGCNIKLGYDNRIFSGNENVTWFEAVNLLNKTLKFAGITSNAKNVDMSAPADKADFERLKNILIQKKAKIRKILGPKPEKKESLNKQ
jgi:hypothetical protein